MKSVLVQDGVSAVSTHCEEYFWRFRWVVRAVRFLVWASFLGVVTGRTLLLQHQCVHGLKALNVWGIGFWVVVLAATAHLVLAVDQWLVSRYAGLHNRLSEAQTVSEGDPFLYNMYTTLHWREWVRQSFAMAYSLVALGCASIMVLMVGRQIVVSAIALSSGGSAVSWLGWYLGTGLLLRGVGPVIRTILGLFEEVQDRVDLKMEVQKAKCSQERRWRHVVAECLREHGHGMSYSQPPSYPGRTREWCAKGDGRGQVFSKIIGDKNRDCRQKI